MQNKQKIMAVVMGSKGVIKMGLIIQKDYPEIAEMYRSGKSLTEIVNELGLIDKYDFSNKSTAASAVSYALRGHGGEFGLPAYAGSIQDKSELEQLAAEHNYKSGKKLQEDGKGMFKLSKEERDKIRENAFQKSYEKMITEGTGLLGRSKEQMQEDSRKALKAKGIQPWLREGDLMSDGTICKVSEVEFMHKLAQQPEYRSKKNLRSAKLACELNKVYHNNKQVRTSRSVNSARYYHRSNKQ